MFRVFVPGSLRLHVFATKLKIVLFPCLEITHLAGQDTLEVKIGCCYLAESYLQLEFQVIGHE